MAEDLPIVYQKPLDYATVYADGVMLQMSEDNSRLIFYQQATELTEDSTGIDRARQFVRLMFEVRIPKSAVKRLGNAIERISTVTDRTFAAVQDSKDPKVTEAWLRFAQKLGNAIYDSRNRIFRFEGNENAAILQEFAEWVRRSLREKGATAEQIEQVLGEAGLL